MHVAQRARRIANLDLDMDEPASARSRATRRRPAAARPAGPARAGDVGPVRDGVRAIIGQQVSVAAANTVAGRLVERYGTRCPDSSGFGLTHTFPSASTLADADLDGLGLTRARARRSAPSPARSPTTRSASTAASGSTSSSRRSRRSTGSARGRRTTSPCGSASATRSRRPISGFAARWPTCAEPRPARRRALATVAGARGDAPLAGRRLRQRRAA